MILNVLLDFFTLMGMGVTALGLVLLLAWIKEKIEDWYADARWKWKYKHRFDKKPIAKCYCKDCDYFKFFEGSTTMGTCSCYSKINPREVADNMFCSFAYPRKNDPERKK